MDFSVDEFMQEYQLKGDGNLETLRDHLGIYLKVLRSAMIDLINRWVEKFLLKEMRHAFDKLAKQRVLNNY